ncbi:MAG: hypothetical protein HOW73_36360 [Polyangiaceae bacterium]|nr:hypothetical protein [Polyangiaceae bacterium]
MRLAGHAALALAAAVFLGPSLAFAQPKSGGESSAEDAKNKARELFTKGAKALDDKKFSESLELLSRAEELFHAPTHVLYIARAQVGLGRLMDAKATYEKLRDEKLPPGASPGFIDAQAKGKAELDDLDRRIPKVVVVLEPKSASGLAITMNGSVLDPAHLGVGFGVAPGSYVFEAHADGLESGKVTVEAAERTTTEVKLVLQPLGRAKSGTSGSTVSSTGGGWSGMKIASLPLMGVGGAGLVVGGILGGLHFVRQSEADDKYATCFQTCRDEIESLDEEATTFGNASIGLLAGGAAALATGIVLFVVAPSDAPSDDAPASATAWVRVVPGGIGVEGRF